MEINYTDIMNLKAISVKGTSLINIMAYWDAFDRGYPNFIDFTNSIKKLENLKVIKIHSRDRNSIIYNTIYEHMTIIEMMNFFMFKSENLIIKVLRRNEVMNDSTGLTITEEDYNLLINEYLSNSSKY